MNNMITIKRPARYYGMLYSYYVTVNDDENFKLRAGAEHSISKSCIGADGILYLDVTNAGAMGDFKIKDALNLASVELKATTSGSSLRCEAKYADGRVVSIGNKKEGQNQKNYNVLLLIASLFFAFMCFKGFHFGYR